MASSGWQGEQTIYSGGGSAPRLDGDLYISSITHSGTSLRVVGKVEVISPANSAIYYNGAYIWCDGGWSTSANLNSDWGTRGTWYFDIDVTIGGVSQTTTSYYFEMGVNAVQSGGSIGWTITFDQSGTQPTGLSTSLVGAGPDWADIAVTLTSWGSPSTSANRYIEAAILGSSTYGNPYKYKTAKAVMTNTFRVDNSSSGGLTIVPNTLYHYGGFASNTVMNTKVVSGTFTTLPAVPIINALDQGHGVINVTVTHANEGSALPVTEEYSIDGGTTWTTITGGAFSLTLLTQTVLTVRRTSTAGVSSDTVTVAPHFDVAIYASVMNKSKLITKVYARGNAEALATISVDSGTLIEFTDTDTYISVFNAKEDAAEFIRRHPASSRIYVRKYSETTGGVTVYYCEIWAGADNESLEIPLREAGYGTTSPDLYSSDVIFSELGIKVKFGDMSYGTTAYVEVGYTTTPTSTIEWSRKVKKIYASVNGKTKLVFEDPS